eukprot:4459086-Amphidinium_carterae.1
MSWAWRCGKKGWRPSWTGGGMSTCKLTPARVTALSQVEGGQAQSGLSIVALKRVAYDVHDHEGSFAWIDQLAPKRARRPGVNPKARRRRMPE